MGVVDRLRHFGIIAAPEAQRANLPLSFQEWVNYFRFGNNTYAYQLNQTLVGDREEIVANFSGLVAGAYKTSGIVFSCMVIRQLLFSEARFQWRQLRNGRPGDLFGTPELRILEKPWPRGSTSDLLLRAISDADLAGTAFFVRRRRDRIARLRPDWTTIICGSPYADASDDLSAYDVDAELLGLAYKPGGPGSGRQAEFYDASNVAIFTTVPDPMANYRGLSWVQTVIPEIQADQAAIAHKERFFINGATVNLVVQTGLSASDVLKFQEWTREFRKGHEGVDNANKTLFLTTGADAKAIGSDLQQAQFRDVVAAGETRICDAAMLHPTLVGVSEGLQGSSLNAGNFDAAVRMTANKFMRPTWRNISHSFEDIVPAPNGAELWYDDRDIPLLADDIQTAAKVQQENAETIHKLIVAGYAPDAVVDAVTSGDFELLKGKHSGLFSVQLQPPQPEGPPEPAPEANGAGSKEDANAVVGQA